MLPKAVVLSLIVLAGACSAKVRPAPPLIPPAGVTTEQVEYAIRAALSKVKASWGPGGGYYWTIDSGRPEAIIVELRFKKYYLKLAIRYSTSIVTTAIVESRNFDEAAITFNDNPRVWQKRVETGIYYELNWLTPAR